MSSFNNNNMNNTNTNMDDLLIRTLLGRLQIRPPNNPLLSLSQSLEELLLDAANVSDDDPNKTQFDKEEAKLEKEIIKVINSGKIDTLQANSGQAVSIGDHHVCVGFHDEKDSEYRVWEWHGHIMVFDEEDGYNPEYVYGNYFESRLIMPSQDNRVVEKEEEEDEDEDEEEEEEVVEEGVKGLKELIDTSDSNGARILHRNLIAASPRFDSYLSHNALRAINLVPIGWMKDAWTFMLGVSVYHFKVLVEIFSVEKKQQLGHELEDTHLR
ncbi:hypothetical protein ACFE04_000630 [Oxalis oulophora]